MEVVNEISGAIIAITLVMTAVFIPVTFIPGPVGVFYRQFGITMASSIVLSGVVALTLTPVLCAMILKPHGHQAATRWSARSDQPSHRCACQQARRLLRAPWPSTLLGLGVAIAASTSRCTTRSSTNC